MADGRDTELADPGLAPRGSGLARSAAGWLAARRRLPARARVRGPLVVFAALLVLRAVQAVVAGLAVLAVAASGLDQPAPGLRMARLAELEPTRTTGLIALTMVLISAGLAAALLSRRHPIAAFAGVKAFALVAASAIAVMFASEPVGVRAAVAGCGAGIVLLLWPMAREAAIRVLAAIGMPHVQGRVGDLLLGLKIALLVGLVLVP